MKQVSFSFALVAILFFSFLPREKEEFIDWNAGHRLSWDDFKGKPAGAADEAANTNTFMGFDMSMRNNVVSYKISCRFSKSKSWVKVKTDHILQHEQGHFDIAEIFARKLNKAAKEYLAKKGSQPEKLGEVYQQVMKEKIALQTAYDDETDHSRNKEQQKEWLQKIETLLTELEPYADY
jgi:Bacterial protein of unknown function (DUF922)